MSDRSFDAVFWDFGGVVTTSPFEAFNTYEAANGIPKDFIRGVNTHNPDTNAWAQIERQEISAEAFNELFATESEALGHRVPGADVLGCLYGNVRPEMLKALNIIHVNGLTQACLTNNVNRSVEERSDVSSAMTIFDHVIESSKVGIRKPEPGFYTLACETAGVSADRVVFLDDLGINLKPAREMGMATIKVVSADQALGELEGLLGIPLR
jgi:putative hydrolase of the HAD superfamily